MAKEIEQKEQTEQKEKQEPISPMDPSYNPWKDMREVFIARRSRMEQPTILVSVNSKSFAVPKDKWIKVPYPVYEVIQNMLEQRKRTEEAAERDFKVMMK